MSAVYKKARKVAVWLGPEGDGLDAVMMALEASYTLHEYYSRAFHPVLDETNTAFRG